MIENTKLFSYKTVIGRVNFLYQIILFLLAMVSGNSILYFLYLRSLQHDLPVLLIGTLITAILFNLIAFFPLLFLIFKRIKDIVPGRRWLALTGTLFLLPFPSPFSLIPFLFPLPLVSFYMIIVLCFKKGYVTENMSGRWSLKQHFCMGLIVCFLSAALVRFFILPPSPYESASRNYKWEELVKGTWWYPLAKVEKHLLTSGRYFLYDNMALDGKYMSIIAVDMIASLSLKDSLTLQVESQKEKFNPDILLQEIQKNFTDGFPLSQAGVVLGLAADVLLLLKYKENLPKTAPYRFMMTQKIIEHVLDFENLEIQSLTATSVAFPYGIYLFNMNALWLHSALETILSLKFQNTSHKTLESILENLNSADWVLPGDRETITHLQKKLEKNKSRLPVRISSLIERLDSSWYIPKDISKTTAKKIIHDLEVLSL